MMPISETNVGILPLSEGSHYAVVEQTRCEHLSTSNSCETNPVAAVEIPVDEAADTDTDGLLVTITSELMAVSLLHQLCRETASWSTVRAAIASSLWHYLGERLLKQYASRSLVTIRMGDETRRGFS